MKCWVYKNKIYTTVKGQGVYVLCTNDGIGRQVSIKNWGWRPTRGR